MPCQPYVGDSYTKTYKFLKFENVTNCILKESFHSGAASLFLRNEFVQPHHVCQKSPLHPHPMIASPIALKMCLFPQNEVKPSASYANMKGNPPPHTELKMFPL